MMNTKLKVLSIGVVAENKQLSSKIIQVCPIEIFPLMDGELRTNPTALESRGIDGNGVEYIARVTADTTIDAEWFSLDTNRRTAPDVRRGEQVLILQHSDTDKFYWISMGRDDEQRRLETVIWAWSDESDPRKDIELTPDNTYSVEVSTHKQLMTLQTCKNNGEAFKYTIQVNAAESKVTITDDNENYIVLDSANVKIHMHNSDGTDFALDKKNITGYAPNDMIMKIDNDCNFTIGNNLTVEVGNNTTIKTKNSTDFSCTNYTLTASASITNTTASYTTDSPISTFTGNVSVGGALAVAGGGGGGGGGPACTVTGDVGVVGGMDIVGDMEVSGVIKCGGLQSATPPTAPGGAWHNP